MELKKYFKKNNIVSVPESGREDWFNSSNTTMTGNGYLGYRGTFPDWSKDQYTACIVSDTYDMADGKWTELCNVPNALFLELELGGEVLLSAEKGRIKNHALNYRYGLSSGAAVHNTSPGGKIEISWERFASYSDIHLLVQKVKISAEKECNLLMRRGIDNDVWSLNGDHFSSLKNTKEGNDLQCRMVTKESGLAIFVRHTLMGENEKCLKNPKVSLSSKGAFSENILEFSEDETKTFFVFMSVYSENDVLEEGVTSYEQAIEQSIKRAVAKGYKKLLQEHMSKWDEKWRDAHTFIKGDDIADSLLKYNMYHNFISTPAHTDTLPIGARGLSCQAYQGAAFWDQEIYNLPMFIYTQPDTARNLLIYRYKTLAGAKKKAQNLGYAGAFYAWISGDSGEELCPDYFFKDVLTGRKIRNHFNDWQIHISPDISYTIIKYFEISGDYLFIQEYGMEMLLEIALFIFSRVHYNPYKEQYEFLKVLGPDEYHENADNNAFTNLQSRYALEKTLELASLMIKKDHVIFQNLQEKTGVSDSVLFKIKDVINKLYIPEADKQSGIIEQFDSYLKLEDITPEKLSKRLIDKQEYWGWPNGIAYETQVMKQADVIQMFVLHSYPVEIMKKNYLYYEPRTQHRSSLSPGVHAIIAAHIGEDEQAYQYFLKSCSVDIANTHPPSSGGTFIGGIHTAACGIAWQIVIFGFAGMFHKKDVLSFKPNLPEHWESVDFSIQYRDIPFNISITKNVLKIEIMGEVQKPVKIKCGGKTHLLLKKGEISLAY